MDIAQVHPARAARLLFQLPHKSRVLCAVKPALQWGWHEEMSNRTNYLLELLVWQNSYDPKKKREHMAGKPKLYVPPFLTKPEETARINKESEVHSIDEIKAILARPRE